jgi:DNA invertase Pin-like site-specific DNA recombinase
MKRRAIGTAAARVRCAIYARKSSEEGLDQRFTSLEAQREACEAFVRSQVELGWTTLPTLYDDGGYSGGTMNRPALQRLLADITAKKVQVVVVYKVDRLTRALADFAKLVEHFDAHGVSFVSVTQPFNTTSSMGRLTLNVLLSFAQFEREVTGERIRDKLAAAKRKGLWMGGVPPIGYRAKERALVADTKEAARVRAIYRSYLALGCVRRLKEALDAKAWRTHKRKTKRRGAGGGCAFSRGHLYRIRRNPIYVGKIIHHGTVSDGQHSGIVPPALWQRVQARLQAEHPRRGAKHLAAASLLAGLLFDTAGGAFTPSHSNKGKRRYRYYVARALHEGGRGSAPDALRLPAPVVEEAVRGALRHFLTDETKIAAALGAIDARDLRARLAEARRLAAALSRTTDASAMHAAVRRLVSRVTVEATRLTIAVAIAALHGPASGANAEDDGTVTLDVPLTWIRHGRAVRLVLLAAEKDTPPIPDATLVLLLSRARDWYGRLTSGRATSVKAIARAEHVSSSYVTRVLYCAFLAPELVAEIETGTAPRTLNATRLLQRVPLPMAWADQRAHLGWPG